MREFMENPNGIYSANIGELPMSEMPSVDKVKVAMKQTATQYPHKILRRVVPHRGNFERRAACATSHGKGWRIG